MAGALDKAKGYGEAGLSIGSALLGSVPAGLGGLYELIKTRDPKKAAEAVESMQESMTYIPRTEQGVKSLQGAAGALETLGAPAAYVGEKTLGATGSPLAATAAEVVLDPLNLLGSAVVAKGTKSAVKGLKGAAERATDVDAIKRYIRSAQQSSGLPGSQVIKPKGGNWMAGSVEAGTKPLRSQAMGQEPAERVKLLDEAIEDQKLSSAITPEFMERLNRERGRLQGDAALNNWVDKKLNKYIKNEMGTPEDPVRALAERGILHAEPRVGRETASQAHFLRYQQDQPKLGKSDLAKDWENLTDTVIEPYKAGTHQEFAFDSVLQANPWLSKVSPETKVYELGENVDRLGFDHLIDELRNSVNPESGLPANLRWSPKDLEKVTVPQAVERVAKINEWRAEQAQKAKLEGMLNADVYKAYPEKDMRWVQLNRPGQFAAESEAMGHSVRGYEPREGGGSPYYGHGGYDAIKEGRAKIYSLRDKKGEPHVTIEVKTDRRELLEREVPIEVSSQLKEAAEQEARAIGAAQGLGPYSDEVSILSSEKYHDAMFNWRAQHPEITQSITQIKGKGNRAPKEEYLPMVQDFVRGGNWSRVGDAENAGLIQIAPDSSLALAMKAKNITPPSYVTQNELTELLRQYREGGFAEGGAVSLADITDKIADQLMLTGMDRDQAILQASRMADAKMQEQKMAGGGLAKAAGKAIAKAAQKAEMNAPVTAQKDLTTLQDFHTSLGDRIRMEVEAARKQMESFDYKYDKGQRVFTKDSAAKNRPPYEILERTRVGNVPMREDMDNLLSKKIIDPATGKVKRTPYEPGYKVRSNQGENTYEFVIPASAIIGDVDMAAGGAVRRAAQAAVKAAEKAAEAKQPVPLVLPPAKPMTKEEMRPIAQRMASQMTGEFVRPDPKMSFNPAGKSRKIFEREKNLPVGVVYKAPEAPAPIVDIEKQQGSVLVGVPGDPTIGSAARAGTLMQVPVGTAELKRLGDVELEQGVQLFGGPRYGAGMPDQHFWASGLGAARAIQNRITDLSKVHEAPVLGQYIKMSPESTNFALHNLDALLAYQQPEKLSKTKREMLEREIRKGSPKYGSFPGFAGFDDPIDVLLQAQVDSNLRKHIAETLMKPTVTEKLGLRPGSDVLFGITEPSLRNIETGASGFSVGKMVPGADLSKYPTAHPTYDVDIPGQFIGQTKYPIPAEVAFPSSMSYARSQLKPGVQEFNMLKFVGPREKIDQQYIDQMKMYEELMKEYTGKKKGGAVKKPKAGALAQATR
jgi:hypothetical protein